MAASGILHLTLAERRSLFRTRDAWLGVAEMAARLGRHRSTIYRELGRNCFRDPDAPRDCKRGYLIRVSTSKYLSAITRRP